MKTIVFILISMALITSTGFSQSVPKAWTHGMKLQSSYSGGMTQYSYKLVINDSISYFDVINEKGAKHYERKFTQQELNNILMFLEKSAFDKIKSEETGPTHDKGSESVILTWDFEVIGASESADMRIVEEYRGNFSAIQTYLQELFLKKKNK